ncbi:MAG: DUF3696 domain-containing protein, partial [Methyloprofundus sp.]|nr:DUF3696 domain-containing protein [Methyloprofundus sp.]
MKLNRISISNFKSLKDVEINLGQLTLLAGINSSGKSSIIQALLLIKENINTLNNLTAYQYPLRHEIGINTLLKTGEFAELGNTKQWLSYDSSDDNISFSLGSDDATLQMLIETKATFDLKESQGDNTLLAVFEDDCFCYLKTDRTSPANDFPYSEEKVAQGSIGAKGEYTAHYLSTNHREKLAIKALKHPKSLTEHLMENVSMWLQEISKGVSVSTTPYPELQRVALSYQYEYGDNTTANFSPLNVGFGLTYVLPVIVAILKAKTGDLVIIENPESHLHPKGQAKIAQLFAIAAHNGVQIIVETHSDHFLNGLRVATKNEIIKPAESQIYYCYKKDGELNTKAQNINIDADGKMNDWPVGFF